MNLTDAERAELRTWASHGELGASNEKARVLRLLDERDRLAALVKSQHDAALETALIADEARAEVERLRRECDERLAESDAFTHMSTRALRAEAENERLRVALDEWRTIAAEHRQRSEAAERERDELRDSGYRLSIEYEACDRERLALRDLLEAARHVNEHADIGHAMECPYPKRPCACGLVAFDDALARCEALGGKDGAK